MEDMAVIFPLAARSEVSFYHVFAPSRRR